MGAWGVKLYQDDVAQDVREQYMELLKKGESNEKATNQILNEYKFVLIDTDDGPVFWFALAETQWSLGRLLPEVKEQALTWIDNGSDQARWEKENPKKAPERKKILEDLRIKLNSPMPPMKKMSQPEGYKCEWEIGDVYAYKLESDYAREMGIYGRYFLFQKIDEMSWYPKHIIPVVWVKLTNGNELPRCEKEYLELRYFVLGEFLAPEYFSRLDKNPFEIEKLNTTESNKKLFELTHLHEYRIYLINTSKRIIPKKLIFLGNYSKNKPPQDEYLRDDGLYGRGYIWKNLEESLLKLYTLFNLER